MSINQITKMRLKDGREVAFVDWTDNPRFSTIEILHGAANQELNFFQYVVGDSVPAFAPVAITAQRTANEMDTNMAAPGAMASTEEFLVYAIRPEVMRFAVADAAAPNFGAPAALGTDFAPAPTPTMLAVLAARTTMNLEISQKVYANAGFGYFNFGAGVMSSPASGQIGMQGLPSQDAVRGLAVPQHIGGQEKFRLFLTHIDDGTGNGIEVGQLNADEVVEEGPNFDDARFARVRVYLDGLHKRPVS